MALVKLTPALKNKLLEYQEYISELKINEEENIATINSEFIPKEDYFILINELFLDYDEDILHIKWEYESLNIY